MKLLKSFTPILLIYLLQACGQGYKSDLSVIYSADSDVEGKWIEPCVAVEIPAPKKEEGLLLDDENAKSKNFKEQVAKLFFQIITVHKNGGVSTFYSIHGNNECNKPKMTFKIESTYKIVGPSANVAGAIDIDYTMGDTYLSVNEKGFVDIFIKENGEFFGYKSWPIDVYQVIDRDAVSKKYLNSEEVPIQKKGEIVLNLFKRSGDKIQFGRSFQWEKRKLLSFDKRPSQLELETFIREK